MVNTAKTFLVTGLLVAYAAPTLAASTTSTAPASAPTTAATQGRSGMRPQIIHIPVVSTKAGEEIQLKIKGDDFWLARRMLLYYRHSNTTTGFTEIEFKRRDRLWTATIPAADVRQPGVVYAIASELIDGPTVFHFASQANPHPVNVFGSSMEQKRDARLEAHNGRTSRFTLRSHVSKFGKRNEKLPDEDVWPPFYTGGDYNSDQYWLAEMEYLYRPLTWVYDYRFGFGVMRGQRPTVEGESIDWRRSPNKQPGLNYGYSDVNIAVHRYITFGPRLIFGTSDKRFVAGGGANIYLGHMEGTHFHFGVDGTLDIGLRLVSEFHLATLDKIPLTMTLEFTDWPYDERPLSTNLVSQVGYKFVDYIIGTIRAGLTNRAGSTKPGYTLGGALSYEF